MAMKRETNVTFKYRDSLHTLAFCPVKQHNIIGVCQCLLCECYLTKCIVCIFVYCDTLAIGTSLISSREHLSHPQIPVLIWNEVSDSPMPCIRVQHVMLNPMFLGGSQNQFCTPQRHGSYLLWAMETLSTTTVNYPSNKAFYISNAYLCWPTQPYHPCSQSCISLCISRVTIADVCEEIVNNIKVRYIFFKYLMNRYGI